MEKLDRAQREASRLTDTENFIARHNRAIQEDLARRGVPEAERLRQSERRIYAPAPDRKRMSFGMDPDGSLTESPEAFRLHLSHTSVVLHSRSSTLYGVTDIDDMYQYLGGLSLAVKEAAGNAPRQLILDNRTADRVRVTPLKRFLAVELRTRAFHPDWIAAQQKENYAGAGMIARTVDNLWGWQSVTPENVTTDQWNELYEVYLQDRHQLGLSRFFRRETRPCLYRFSQTNFLHDNKKLGITFLWQD